LICAALHGHRLSPVVAEFSDLPSGTVIAHRSPADGGVLALALAALLDAARCVHGRQAVDGALQIVATQMIGGLFFAKAAAWCRSQAGRDAVGLAVMDVEPRSH